MTRSRRRQPEDHVEHDTTCVPNVPPSGRTSVILTGLALVLLVGGVYVATIRPDVRAGDSAEIQLMAALLGVCHPPGYGLLVSVGHLFTLLPFGPDAAWRVNLMLAVCGVLGALTLFGVLRRLTGRVLPAFLAALTLAFSIAYWMHSVVTEVYVFHALFLLLALYAAVRFFDSDRARWLYLAALCLGICIGGRLSEVTVIPAFVVLWLGARRRVRVTWKRTAISAALACLPFAYNAGYFLCRQVPGTPPVRDDALRDEILNLEPPVATLPAGQRLKEAIAYSAGLRGRGRENFTEVSWWRLGWDLNKYAWQLSGIAAWGDRFPEESRLVDPILAFRQREQGSGTSITILGTALALFGFRHWRRRKHVLLCGALLFLGNLSYYLYMHPVDNLQFILPGLIGLTLLIACGLTPHEATASDTSGKTRRGPWKTGMLYAFGAVPPLFLLLTNWSIFNYQTPAFQQSLESTAKIKATPLPPDTVIIATYPPAQRFRYLYWAAMGRTDIHVILFREEYDIPELRKLVQTLHQRGVYTLLCSEVIGKEDTMRMLAQITPAEFVAIGLYQFYPQGKR